MNKRQCIHGLTFVPGSPYTLDQCRVCWLESVRHRFGVKDKTSDPALVQRPIRITTEPMIFIPTASPCQYRGDDELTGIERNKLGLSHQKIWYHCEKGVNNGAVCECLHCKTCNYRIPNDRFPRKNLLYHVYPIKGNGIWQWNVSQILERIALFSEKRIVAIATSRTTDTAESVIESFNGHRIDEFITVPNDPHLREVKTWIPLWSKLDQNDPEQITFYAHTKGVSRQFNPTSAIQKWVEMMYEGNLDYYPVVLRQLDIFPITGMFKKIGRCFNSSQSNWHYSGTFYWVRNVDFYKKNWKGIDQRWWGNESFPGIYYGANESACIYGEGNQSSVDLYDMRKMMAFYEGFQRWKLENSMHRFHTSSLTDSSNKITAMN